MNDFAVLFDFNGTMLFDTDLQYHAWDEVLQREYGLHIEYQEFLHSVNGRTSAATVKHYFGDVSEDIAQRLTAQKREEYRRQCLVTHKELFHLADGLPKVLDLLKKNNVPFTIATSSHPSSMDFYFEHLQLGEWFLRDKVVCSDRNFPGKPAPDIYRLAAREVDMQPKDCIVIEDAEAGAEAARAAGIGKIICIDSENTGLIWVDREVDAVIRSHKDLYILLLGMIERKKQEAIT